MSPSTSGSPFVDALAGDYALQAASPAIDAGDPALPLDPDGTTADAGALPYFQVTAAATVHNGSGSTRSATPR